jgi:hypothetical protein
MTINSRQAAQNAVERFMARIMASCEESALHEEDGTSIDLDALVDFVWPDGFFEGSEKDVFCRRRYHSVTSAHDRLIDTLDPAERERLVIIHSIKDRISDELHQLGFVEHHELQSRGCFERTSSYEWQLRRFCDSGPGYISWLHLKWSVAEGGCSPMAEDSDVEQIPMRPCVKFPLGVSSSRASTRDIGCGASGLSSGVASGQPLFRV